MYSMCPLFLPELKFKLGQNSLQSVKKDNPVSKSDNDSTQEDEQVIVDDGPAATIDFKKYRFSCKELI